MSRRLTGLVALLLLAAAGCTSPGTPPPRPPTADEPEQPARGPAPEAVEPAEPQDPAERGDALYSAGDYGAAAGAYAQTLAHRPDHPSAPWILLRMAIVQLVPESRVHDPSGGAAALERLMAEYPDSPAATTARLILGLVDELDELDVQTRRQQTTIQELRQQLESLKQIDLEKSDEPPPR